jgi:recombinational DNA repair protein (RecF pathway)
MDMDKMDLDQASADHCADCHHPLEIITVRFSLAGAEVISACPNCASAKDGAVTHQESDDAAQMKQAEVTRIDTQRAWRRLKDSLPGSYVR